MEILRKELYEKIWSIGISKTANELNVPYTKLKSICTKHNVPLPTPSYWGTLHMGNTAPFKTPLPNPEQNYEISLETVRNATKKNNEQSKLVEPKLSKSKPVKPKASEQPIIKKPNYFNYFSEEEQTILLNAYNSLKMNKSLSTKPHKEIVKFKQKQKNPDPYYMREPELIIKSAANIIFPETFIFIDSLFKALEKANATIVTTLENTQIHYKHYIFSLIFRIPSTKVTLTPDDKEYTSYNTYKYVPKGILSIEIERNERWFPNYPKTVTVTQKANEDLEALLKRLFLKIFSLAPVEDEVKRLLQIEEEEKKRKAEERARIIELHNNEFEKTEALIRNSLNFYFSKLIKDYIDFQYEGESEEYNWALNKANWIKNSDNQPDSILSDNDREKLLSLIIGTLP